jgi:hypothetical protein
MIERDQPMTRDELRDRIAELAELMPGLAEIEEGEWTETPAGEPFVMMGEVGLTGLDSGAVELIGPIPNTGLVAVYRIKPDNHFDLVGLVDDPAIAAQAALNCR